MSTPEPILVLIGFYLAFKIMSSLFITALIIMDVGAAISYAVEADWKRCVYWLAAATLTVCVTL